MTSPAIPAAFVLSAEWPSSLVQVARRLAQRTNSFSKSFTAVVTLTPALSLKGLKGEGVRGNPY